MPTDFKIGIGMIFSPEACYVSPAPPANAPVNRFSPFTSAPATFYAPP